MRLERRLQPRINVDLTPLIDVVFQLVIFFMISSVFKTAPGIPLELPVSTSSEAASVSELRITAISETEIYVNKTLTSLEGLDRVLAEALLSFGEQKPRATLEGDAGLPYKLMVGVLDSLRNAGVDGVDLMTRGREAPP